MRGTSRNTVRAAAVLALTLLALPCAAQTDSAIDPCARMEVLPGSKLFAENCTFCHGPDGKGGGILAKEMKLTPPDLTTLAERSNGAFPTEYVFKLLKGESGKSHGGMPNWKSIFTDECGPAPANRAVTELGVYVKGIQAK
ncbi:cytochrome c [Rhodomicrobium vannielii ATCC 17100]|uniref:c-type cytochrome n=1 Tax=Rhodomicrobium vannielii TaxID=1069 RepID=UPI00191AB5B0|nr:cytochrome c [Rhodomicrobium vannielii]MBJ7535450.1 cytochrome c [Rhodomicrobium vannielii ATCC 17100]